MLTMSKSEFQLRDVFNAEMVNRLTQNLAQAWPPFDQPRFVNATVPQFPALSFGARNSLIADALHAFLPDDYNTAVTILISALGPEPQADSLSGFDGMIIMPQCLFVSRYGLDQPDISLNALYEMTKRFTAEGDIRPFLQTYPTQTLTFLHKLTQDPSPFARRLASEGTRPRLPLAPRLPQFQQDPTPVLQLLEKLKNDPNLMVRRSVANNLNDIAKDNPNIVVATLEQWQQPTTPEIKWITSHALRTLLKQGHPGALNLLDYNPAVSVTVSEIQLNDNTPAIGDKITFSFTVTSRHPTPCRLMIDYVIYFMKANGRLSPKVFKAAKKQITPGQTITITKRHSFQQRSTRRHYPGHHSLAVQINGQAHSRTNFELSD